MRSSISATSMKFLYIAVYCSLSYFVQHTPYGKIRYILVKNMSITLTYVLHVYSSYDCCDPRAIQTKLSGIMGSTTLH